jgi:hypothetical protein
MSFWDVVLWCFWVYLFLAYLTALFAIVVDLFRDDSVGGFGKAVWMILLIFVPFLTAFVYLIARGRGMGQRAAARNDAAKAQMDAYIRSAAGSSSSSPTEEITRAAQLRDAGTITAEDYEAIKAKALA